MTDKINNNKQQNQAVPKQPTQQQPMRSQTSSLTNRKLSVDELCNGNFRSKPDDVLTFIKVYCDEYKVAFKEVNDKEVKLFVVEKLPGAALYKCIQLSSKNKSIDLLFIVHPNSNQWCIYYRINDKLVGKIETAMKSIYQIKKYFNI